jgi:hypothetical protein
MPMAQKISFFPPPPDRGVGRPLRAVSPPPDVTSERGW